MISTTELTGVQLLQLDALLADTTPGGGVYRPPVATDDAVVRQLVDAGLAYRLQDVLFDHYELTDLGREIALDRARDAADSEAFVRCATRHELREAIRKLKAVFNDLTDPVLRERTLQDIEACQDRLDDLADGPSESTGRHRLVPVDDRPTETINRVELPPTEPMPIAGTLPGLPVVERVHHDVPDQESAERLLAAIRDADTSDEVFDDLAAEQTDQWAALEADLGDQRSWLRRNLTPRRKFVLTVVATVVVTWFVAWLVMA